MPDYNFPSSKKQQEKTNKSTGRLRLLVVLLIIFNIATIYIAHQRIEAIRTEEEAKFTKRVNELERFYYGFCSYTKDLGLANGLDYERLCGDL